jgi:hypothetical protein
LLSCIPLTAKFNCKAANKTNAAAKNTAWDKSHLRFHNLQQHQFFRPQLFGHEKKNCPTYTPRGPANPSKFKVCYWPQSWCRDQPGSNDELERNPGKKKLLLGTIEVAATIASPVSPTYIAPGSPAA